MIGEPDVLGSVASIARAINRKRANHPITYTDAASFAVMEALSCREACTFDHDFAVGGFTRWSLDGRGTRETRVR